MLCYTETKAAVSLTPFCKVPQFAAFLAAEPINQVLLCKSGALFPEEQ